MPTGLDVVAATIYIHDGRFVLGDPRIWDCLTSFSLRSGTRCVYPFFYCQLFLIVCRGPFFLLSIFIYSAGELNGLTPIQARLVRNVTHH